MVETAATRAFLTARKRHDQMTATDHKPKPKFRHDLAKPNPTLNDPYRSTVLALMQRPSWTAAAFKTVVSGLAPMPLAVLKRVNDWSLALFGDVLLNPKPDGTICVNQDLKNLIDA